jgi:hypothetical protein
VTESLNDLIDLLSVAFLVAGLGAGLLGLLALRKQVRALEGLDDETR